MKYVRLVREHFKKQPVFSLFSLRAFLRKQGISRNYSKLLIHNLLKKDEIQRISKGFYTFQADSSVVGFAFSPFYYGLQEALSIRNLWEQETIPVIITPRKVRSGLRKAMGSNFLIRRIGRKMFFGFDLIKHFDFWLPVSDFEKTLIDFAYFNQPLPRQALAEIKSKISKKKLNQYLKKTPLLVRKKVKKMLGMSVMKNNKICLITTNKERLAFVKKTLAEYGVVVERAEFDNLEIQADSAEEIAVAKALNAAESLNKNCVCEDTEFSITALNGFPGPYFKYVQTRLSPENVLKLLENAETREAKFKSVLAFARPDGFCKTFETVLDGTITKQKNGSFGKGWDCIFKLKEFKKTLAEFKLEERFELWNSGYKKLGEWLKKRKLI